MDRQELGVEKSEDFLDEDPREKFFDELSETIDVFEKKMERRKLAVWVMKNAQFHCGHFLPKMMSIFFPVSAIAIGRHVFFRDWKPSENMIRHEVIHVAQQKEIGMFSFMLQYFYYWMIGLFKEGNPYEAYLSIPFEKEAYENQHNQEYLWTRDRCEWRKHI